MSKPTTFTNRRSVRNRRFAPTAVALLASVSLLAAGCGNGGTAPEDGSTSQGRGTSAEPAAIAEEELLKLPVADTYGDIPDAPRDPAPQSRTDGLVLRVETEMPVYRDKGGEPFAKMPERQLGSPTWVPVIKQDGDWYQVLLPSRPNGSVGWLHATGDNLQEAHNDHLVVVDRDSFELTVRENGKEIGSWTIGTGKPEYPTPKGRTFIMASLEETVTDYSPIILPLGAHSASHTTFGGGPGTVGIHGWPDDSPFGKQTSDGCIRVPDDALELLSTLPLGTIVLIK